MGGYKIISLLAPDCLVCGTDSREFFNKSSISNEITKAVADTSFKITYSIDKREIRISADANTAISVEQCYIKPISQKMPVRMVSHLVKSGNDWLIDFISISFIPNNEDLGKLNKAL